MVIKEAYNTWKVAMQARRSQAKLHVRVNSLTQSLQEQNLPPWSYGIAAMPEFLQPLSTDIVDLIKA
jgi:hypothetical protein